MFEAALAASDTDLVLITELFITLGHSSTNLSYFFQVYTQSWTDRVALALQYIHCADMGLLSIL